MKSILGFRGGIIFILVGLVGVGYFVVEAGFVPANVDSKSRAVGKLGCKHGAPRSSTARTGSKIPFSRAMRI